MFEFIKRLFHQHTCEHQWKCVHQVEEIWYDEEGDKYPTNRYLVKTYECQKCGKIKYITQEL